MTEPRVRTETLSSYQGANARHHFSPCGSLPHPFGRARATLKVEITTADVAVRQTSIGV